MFYKIKNKLLQYKKLIELYSDEETVFVYQMGKVGSTSLQNSIDNSVHIHSFYSKNHICPIRSYGLKKFGLVHIFYKVEEEVRLKLLRYYFRKRASTKVITLVREPMARNKSMFFHDIDAYLYAAHTNCFGSRNKPIPTRIQNNKLLNDAFESEFNHDYPLTWFDKEFLPITGVDIFKYPFDKEKGFVEVEAGKIQVLCLSIDVLSQSEELLSKFLGTKVTLNSINKADKKWYGDIYKDFIDNYSEPTALRNRLNKSRFYRHFF